jgi:hypothetical protein
MTNVFGPDDDHILGFQGPKIAKIYNSNQRRQQLNILKKTAEGGGGPGSSVPQQPALLDKMLNFHKVKKRKLLNNPVVVPLNNTANQV